MPPAADSLPFLFDEMIRRISKIDDIYLQSFSVFLDMARNQYFYDVNKRTGRFMMNGLLLSSGFPAISVPSKKRLEFNRKMIRFYDSNDPEEMRDFLGSCMEPRVLRIMKESKRT